MREVLQTTQMEDVCIVTPHSIIQPLGRGLANKASINGEPLPRSYTN